jgi:hypothetical protein
LYLLGEEHLNVIIWSWELGIVGKKGSKHLRIISKKENRSCQELIPNITK